MLAGLNEEELGSISTLAIISDPDCYSRNFSFVAELPQVGVRGASII